jgi:hypothetical protein
VRVLEVKPTPGGKWGVYDGDTLVAESKYSFDCDLFAERLAKICEGVTVNHHPSERK